MCGVEREVDAMFVVNSSVYREPPCKIGLVMPGSVGGAYAGDRDSGRSLQRPVLPD